MHVIVYNIEAFDEEVQKWKRDGTNINSRLLAGLRLYLKISFVPGINKYKREQMF